MTFGNPTSPAHAFKLATIRRRWNETRQDAVRERRAKMALLLGQHGDKRGVVAWMSRQLGVPHPTVVRDLQAIRAERCVCLACGQALPEGAAR